MDISVPVRCLVGLLSAGTLMITVPFLLAMLVVAYAFLSTIFGA